jgi:hypothetical protein
MGDDAESVEFERGAQRGEQWIEAYRRWRAEVLADFLTRAAVAPYRRAWRAAKRWQRSPTLVAPIKAAGSGESAARDYHW